MTTGELPEDISDLAEKARTIAEATGRTEEDVLTDLLDDGKANMSAGQDIEKMDFLDKAQEQAEKFKKLLTTLIPVLALLLSIGAEGLGVMDITGWGSDSVWEDDDPIGPPPIRWGCMDSDALNYDETATQDDGTCEDEPPPCVNSWLYEDTSHEEEQNIIIEFTFYDDHDCETEIDGHFIITLYSNGSQIDDAFVNVGHFTDSVDVNYEFTDLDAGTYNVSVELHELACETGTCEHADEWTMEQNPTFSIENEPIQGCTDDTATNYDTTATVDDGSCEYPPPRCEITLWDILLETNNSSAHLQYDLDCGDDENAEGFNVSVQFWNTIANTTDTVNYSIGFHYIQGDAADTQELFLHNITCNTYDFKWIAIWEDEDGNAQDLYETWSDIYMAGEAVEG